MSRERSSGGGETVLGREEEEEVGTEVIGEVVGGSGMRGGGEFGN